MRSRKPAAMKPFVKSRLARIADVLESDVAAGKIPGAVVLLVHDGDVAYEHACGVRERANGTAMTRDTLFRIASMTKPIVSVAAMMLVEEGRLALTDPVAMHLPAFEDVRVGVDAVRPRRPPTVHDLLRHTSGLTYAHTGDTPIHDAYRAKGVGDRRDASADFIAKLASIPLLYEPGSTWEYGMSTDVLGCVVEAVEGETLGRVLARRVFEPLEMTETSFTIDPSQHVRLAEADRGADGIDPLAYLYDPARTDTRFEPGGAGLVSTAHDYARFAATFVPSDARHSPVLLGRKTLASMTSDHLPPGYAITPLTGNFGVSSPLPEFGQGFGLGLSVRLATGRNPSAGSVGDVSWSGVSGTYFWVDPAERLVAIFLSAAPGPRVHYRELMRNMVYAALR